MKELEAEIREYLKERGWDQLHPGNVAKSISIEAAELLEHFQWDNPSLAEVVADPEKMAAIKKELADVLIYAIDMAVLLNIDTAAIIREKLEKVRTKYPKELFKQSAEVQGTQKIYWDIKNSHRREGTN